MTHQQTDYTDTFLNSVTSHITCALQKFLEQKLYLLVKNRVHLPNIISRYMSQKHP